MSDQLPVGPVHELEEAEMAASDQRGGGPSKAAATATQDEAEALEELRRQRDEYYDRLLRKTAEFDNYRKRIDRERRELQDRAAMTLIAEILPLVDDLERALEPDVAEEGVEAYRKGVEIIHRQLMDVLRKRGVRPIDALGATFDPHFHEAVAHEVSPGCREGEIIEELRRGYMLGDRLLRPAVVKVAKA
ncbi:MAG: nucleotide exchange factor GrpE [Acidobacteria bacterium]|nr:nucleotide exchange factor GrpE [Acidobacteriota bacterium]